jgi:hypothetical protein
LTDVLIEDNLRGTVLEWLFPGQVSEKHKALQELRAINSGEWFIGKDEFKKWATGTTASTLFCPGIGNNFIYTLLTRQLDLESLC